MHASRLSALTWPARRLSAFKSPLRAAQRLIELGAEPSAAFWRRGGKPCGAMSVALREGQLATAALVMRHAGAAASS